MRRCLWTSYTLGHTDECAAVYERIANAAVQQIDIQPRGKAQGSADPACDTPRIALDDNGMTVSRRGSKHRHDGAFDAAWLEADLRAMKPSNCSDIEVSATANVEYQSVIHAMDVAIKTGYMDTGVVTPGEHAASAPAHAASQPAAAGSAVPLASGAEALANAPAIIVTKTEITVAGKHLVAVADVARGSGSIDELAKALPAGTKMAILQADAATDASVINRIVDTLKANGIDNILFAVKNR
jgi:biopolymer transport protein ExbD